MQRYTVYLFLDNALYISHTTESRASGTCQNVTVTCRYRGGVGSSNFSMTAAGNIHGLTSARCYRYSCMCS